MQQVEDLGVAQNGYKHYRITYEDGFTHVMYLNDESLNVEDLSQTYRDMKLKSYTRDELEKRGYYAS